MSLNRRGRTWIFDDDINTDLILPIRAYYLPVEEQPSYVFSANRPGWVELVKAGDIIVGGKNFGVGSSRPAPRSLKNLGIGGLIAESINGLFYRNCVNWGFPAMECPGVHDAFAEGEEAEMSFDQFTVRNVSQGTTLKGQHAPASLLDLMDAGGIYPLLEREGLIAPKT